MATLNIFEGQPGHDLVTLMATALGSGTLSDSSTTEVTLTFGSIVVTFLGTDLQTDGNRTFEAGTIGSIEVRENGNEIAALSYDTAIPVANVQQALDLLGGGGTPTQDEILNSLGLILYNEDTTINGSDEDDEIYGAALYQTDINGGGGNDTIQVGDGGGPSHGGDGDDTIYGSDHDDEIKGGDGSDTIFGGDGHDYIRGDEVGDVNQGDDLLYGQGGSDWFKGGAGNDTIDGGDGRDGVHYNSETDFTGDTATHGVIVNLSGEALVNVSVAGIGTTTVAAGTAIDTRNYVDTLTSIEDIAGTGYNDIIVGGADDNHFEGGGGDDLLIGGDGNNHLMGGAGYDTLIGGVGHDFIEGGAGDDTIDGGAGYGYDNVQYLEATSGVTVNKTDRLSGTVTGSSTGIDTFVNMEIVVGSNHDDTFNGSAEDDHFTGNNGADTFNGGPGGNYDRVVYEKEQYAPGGSAANGVAVNLSNVAVNVAAGLVDGVAGAFTLGAGQARDTFGATDTLNSIESVQGTEARDFLQGSDGSDAFFSRGGNDTIRGGGGDDFLAGGGGNDTIDGGSGTDYLEHFDAQSGITITKTSATAGSVNGAAAGIGSDTFTNIEIVVGSGHNDIFNGSSGSDEFIGLGGADTFNGAGGVDTVNYRDENNGGVFINLSTTSFTFASITVAASRGIDPFGQTDIFNSIENIRGSHDNDVVVGSNAANLLEGNDGRDWLFGGSGNDTLRGGNDGDFLVGGAGADTLDGGASGDDTDVADYFAERNGASASNRGVIVNLNTGVARDTFGNTDTLLNIEEASGTNFADTFTGGSDYNGFRGFGGADTYNNSPDGTGHVWVYYGQDAEVGGTERVIVNLSNSTVLNAGAENGTGMNLGANRAKDGFGALDILNDIHSIRGTAFDDWVLGSDENDHFQMQAGDDYIDGAGGSDMVDYQHDIDESSAADDRGVVVNLSGNDLVAIDIGLPEGPVNVAAHTAIDGFGDTDTLLNVERIRGTFFDDYLVGDDNDNEIDGSSGSDMVFAGGGNFDLIDGGPGTDYVDGGDGFDMITFGRGDEDDVISVILDDSALGGGTVSGTKNDQVVDTTFIDVERVKGTRGDDTFTANADFANTDDAFGFGNGHRVFEFVGLDGADTFTDNTASDYGSTLVNYDDEKYDHDNYDGDWNGEAGEIGVNVDLQAGTATDTFGDTDTIVGVKAFQLTDTDDTLLGRDDGSNVFVDGRNGDDTITTFGGEDIIWGGEGDDTISSGDGDDNVDGWDGNDTIDAGGGDDWIGAGWGTDTIDGGDGFDILSYNNADEEAPGDGIDVVFNGALGSGSITGFIQYSGGNDEIHAGAVNVTFTQLEMVESANTDDTFTIEAGFGNTADAARGLYDDRGDDRGEQRAVLVAGNGGNDVFTDNSDASVGGDTGGMMLVFYHAEQWSHDGFDGDHVWGAAAGEHGVIVNFSGSVQTALNFDLNDGGPVQNVVVAAHSALDTHGDTDTFDKVQMVTLTDAADWFWADDNRDSFGNGHAGDDMLFGGGGDDTFVGGEGDDTISGGLGYDAVTYQGEWGQDGSSQSGVIINLSDAIKGGIAAGTATDTFGDTDTLTGIDVAVGTNGADFIYGGAGSDLGGGSEGTSLVGLGGDDWLEGGDFDDLIRGDAGNDTILGGAGTDTVDYGLEYRFNPELGRSGVTVDLGAGSATDTYGDTDSLSGIENVIGTQGDDTIAGDNAANIIVAGGGTDTLTGSGGDDLFVLAPTGQVTITDFAAGLGGGERIDFSQVSGTPSINDLAALLAYVDAANHGDAVFTFGTGNSLTLLGVDYADLVEDDFVFNAAPEFTSATSFAIDENTAGAVADIDADDGNDDELAYAIVGGPDAALFTIDPLTGIISIGTAFDFENPADADQDNVYLLTVEVDDGRGGVVTDDIAITVNNVGGVTITGTAAANTVSASVTVAGQPLPTSEEDVINGLAGNDRLSGLDGNDFIDGGLGRDTMLGGLGDDTYVVDVANDIVTELANEGTDTIEAGLTLTLAGRANVENLTLTGTGNFNGTGNELDNIITGNAGNNALSGGLGDDTLYGLDGDDSLDGGAGADILVGGDGDDSYAIDADDTVTELIGEGTDTVVTAFSHALGANVENLTFGGVAAVDGTGNELDNILTGNGAANVLSGLAGNDRLIGGAGADTLIGGGGDDLYVVDAADIVIEGADEGTDTIESSFTYTLADNLENLTLTGTGAINGTGNDLDNVITGNSRNNVLTGGLGNDTYVINAAGTKTIVEAADEGIDTVQSAFTHTLADNVENLTLTGTGNINGTGNDLDNVITGNSGNNILNGGIGDDTLLGGSGADTYVIDSLLDVVDESGAAAATDLVQSSVDVDLTDAGRFIGDIENVTLLAGASDVVGNSLNNVLTGNAGNNRLDGNGGNDTMAGGAGNDTYVVDSASDVVTEAANAGTDTVESSAAAYTLGANVENLTLTGGGNISGTGNNLANVITGNSGDNELNGGTGNDTLIGGLGDDTYFVDSASDTIQELENEGTDTVRLTSAATTFTLGAHVENLVILGTAAVNGTGNGLANVLTGNNGANILVGGTGADTMIGGGGNDTYEVDDAGDVVDELDNGGAGTDLVRSFISFDLGGGQVSGTVENLTLMGTAAINGTGNGSNNVITGNNASNTLDGKAGNDTMVGLGGNDTYYVDSAADVVTEAVNGGNDTVVSSANYTLGNNVENLVLADGLAINGTGNAVANVLLGNDQSNTLRGLAGNDRLDAGSGGTDVLVGGAGNDIYVVNHGTVTINETLDGGNGIDTVLSGATFDLNTSSTVIGAVENLTLTGSGNVNGFGNALDNVISGNRGDNILGGNAGNDTISGAAGNDTISGGLGNDFLFGGSGADTFDFNAADFTGSMADHVDDIFDYSGLGGDGDVIDIDGLIGDLVSTADDVASMVYAQRSGSDLLIFVNEGAVESGNLAAPADWSQAFVIHDVDIGQESAVTFKFGNGALENSTWQLTDNSLGFVLAGP